MKKYLLMSALIFGLSTLAFSVSAQDVSIGVKEDAIFGNPELAPQFPGGEAKLLKFISDNLHYPEDAKTNKIEGRVITTFIIEKDGSVTNIKVVRGLSTSTDAEAIRVIKLFPKWKPGTQRDQPVKVQYAMPIKFSLNK